jgi:hypothetical protein
VLSAISEQARYVAAGRYRAFRHSSLYPPAPQVADAVRALDRDGYAVLPGMLPAAVVDALAEQAETAIRAGQLSPARVRRAFTEQRVAPDDERQLRQLAQGGQQALASRESMVYISDPLANCPAAAALLFSDPVLDAAAGYYRCPPALISPKIVRSYVNDLPASSVHRFHCDYQHVRFLKIFIYLCDVRTEDDGPFCFVAGSHRHKPAGWRKHPLEWSGAEIAARYGPEAIRPLTARRGDLVVADTRGFHRGIKVRSRARTMLKASTGLRRWRGAPAWLPAQVAAGLSAKQLAAAELLDIR